MPARCLPIVLATLDCVFGAAVFVYACAQTLIDRHFALTYFLSSPESVPFDYPLLHECDEAYCVKLLSRSTIDHHHQLAVLVEQFPNRCLSFSRLNRHVLSMTQGGAKIEVCRHKYCGEVE